MTSIGIISDTHGLLRPEAIDALTGCEQILHAGDIGDQSVIDALRQIAPVTAVRGNIDCGAWADIYPQSVTVTIAGRKIHVLHNLAQLAIDPVLEGIDVVISGHSHQPANETFCGVLYLNPGSAGPRRFKLPIVLATMTIDDSELTSESHTLVP